MIELVRFESLPGVSRSVPKELLTAIIIVVFASPDMVALSRVAFPVLTNEIVAVLVRNIIKVFVIESMFPPVAVKFSPLFTSVVMCVLVVEAFPLLVSVVIVPSVTTIVPLLFKMVTSLSVPVYCAPVEFSVRFVNVLFVAVIVALVESVETVALSSVTFPVLVRFVVFVLARVIV